MAKQIINIGTELDDESAGNVRDSFDICNDNFDELYSITENAQIVSYTLVLTDNLKLVTVTTAGVSTLTVPPNSSVAFPIGATIAICQGGAGKVTITAGVGVTINSKDAALGLTGQWATASLIKTAINTWLCTGSLE